MRKLTGSDAKLQWVQPQAKTRFFELRSGDVVVATLAWEKAFGTLATAQTAEKAWTFKRVVFFNPRVTVRSPDSEADIVLFKPSWGYGGTRSPGQDVYLEETGFLGATGGASPGRTVRCSSSSGASGELSAIC
jgi:hypothetical protein